MLLLRQANLFGRNFDNVCAAYGKIEPLITDGFVGEDFDFVDERASTPVVFICYESLWKTLSELEWAGSNTACGSFPFSRISEFNEEVILSQQRW
jgi:hypothetical protein